MHAETPFLTQLVNSSIWQSRPTWLWESVFGAAVLILVWTVTSSPVGDPYGAWVNAVAGVAVFFTYKFMLVSYRLLEAQERQDEVTVECHAKLRHYLWAKEFLWLLVFLLTGAYTAVVGNFLFLAYPWWRRVYLAARMR